MTSKVPWLIVLYKHLETYRAKHENQLPTTYKQKCELRELIRLSMTADEENYEEAVKAVNSSFGGGKPNDLTQSVLNDDSCVNLNKKVLTLDCTLDGN